MAESDYTRWPARLPEQPIFYPVSNEQYAIEIARDWNVKESCVGYVTRFAVDARYMQNFPLQQVGGQHHTEWWIPAEALEEFNKHIRGKIEVIHQFDK